MSLIYMTLNSCPNLGASEEGSVGCNVTMDALIFRFGLDRIHYR